MHREQDVAIEEEAAMRIPLGPEGKIARMVPDTILMSRADGTLEESSPTIAWHSYGCDRPRETQ